MGSRGTTTSRTGSEPVRSGLWVQGAGPLPRTHRAGFTLIEVILVAVIIGILVAASVPRFKDTAQRLRTEQGAVLLAQQLRYARERAIAQGSAVVWVWDPQQRTTALYEASGEEPPAWRENPDGAVPKVPAEVSLRVERQDDPLSCGDGVGPAACSGCQCLAFQPDGTNQDGASAPTTLALASRQLEYLITVDASSGDVRLSTGTAAH